MRGQPIFIVDDDPDILDAVQITLESADYPTVAITHAEKIYQKINENRPNLILLDVLMSGRDGRDICRKLKGQKETKDIPVIMISAHSSAKRNTVECGANDFIAKPFNIEDLLKKVEEYIGPY